MVIILDGMATFKGQTETTAFRRRIPFEIVIRSFTVAVSAVVGILLFEIALAIVQPELDFQTGLFEIVSAFATTGWSVGATPQLNSEARVVIAVAMFVGRFGPLSLALFMSSSRRQPNYRFPSEQIRVG